MNENRKKEILKDIILSLEGTNYDFKEESFNKEGFLNELRNGGLSGLLQEAGPVAIVDATRNMDQDEVDEIMGRGVEVTLEALDEVLNELQEQENIQQNQQQQEREEDLKGMEIEDHESFQSNQQSANLAPLNVLDQQGEEEPSQKLKQSQHSFSDHVLDLKRKNEEVQQAQNSGEIEVGSTKKRKLNQSNDSDNKEESVSEQQSCSNSNRNYNFRQSEIDSNEASSSNQQHYQGYMHGDYRGNMYFLTDSSSDHPSPQSQGGQQQNQGGQQQQQQRVGRSHSAPVPRVSQQEALKERRSRSKSSDKGPSK